ncbi:MAG: glycosyltransferase family 2 protein [Bdellovibrionales bacterium]|nr:glycosyltransferase family 2 protein [Bdellovibrionales bacterium]
MITLVSVIIPAYNEERTVGTVLRQLLALRLPPHIQMEIIVVNDGSDDCTASVLNEFAGIKVVHQMENRGKGAAVREGLKHAAGEIVVIQDADTEYEISDYPILLAPLLSGNADAVYGSRFLGSIKGMRLPNLIFNKFICLVVWILYQTKITDEATAYKVMRTKIARSLDLKSDRFEICPEITAKLIKRRIKIHEVPIHYTARKKSEGKKITWIDAIQAISTLVRFRLWDR